ncbi:hypothetical protein J6590_040439 [Homalodisca vitripennis]|nr:hypothetical protein J6590_040439 [Homalodisca vitripennis]
MKFGEPEDGSKGLQRPASSRGLLAEECQDFQIPHNDYTTVSSPEGCNKSSSAILFLTEPQVTTRYLIREVSAW